MKLDKAFQSKILTVSDLRKLDLSFCVYDRADLWGTYVVVMLMDTPRLFPKNKAGIMN